MLHFVRATAGTKENPCAGFVFTAGPTANARAGIRAFDLDHTLIQPKGGRKFPKTFDDWQLMPNVLEKLRSLHRQQYAIVVVSNQMSLVRETMAAEFAERKLAAVQAALNVPVTFAVACSKSSLRKPSGDLWERLLEMRPDLMALARDTKYIGDADGHADAFAASDAQFADSIGAAFRRPQYFFGGELPKSWPLPKHPAEAWLKGAESFGAVPSFKALSEKPTLVVLVGPPGSGKTTWAAAFAERTKSVHVSNDLKQTAKAQQRALLAALEAGRSSVVDNTSPSKKARKPYLEQARRLGARCVAIVWQPPEGLAEHLERVRSLVLHTKEPIPKIGFTLFRKNYEAPTRDEFDEVYEWWPKYSSEAGATRDQIMRWL
jgi:bifunctional polynucleotide phosphatase/kinase